ncbi:hypothetical protein HMPREF9336_04221 [Segniliparus rugosus ATCC BAA-974]|uniref:Uncharacterized protein n=1 Tax=Segniliparus rugosus (strain ATCC BAA-974 / DSM 45345 / CCUG 50838 / CIP 108380 / JCM 13579 / CDC 945) TaxID=679197 RepID=U1M2J4_SEGRC|nr:hypothetical protein HMPREF9336_04221 [Segniliparus rugosus ATCC BAA-974]
MLVFAENMTEHYPEPEAKFARGEVTAKTARFVGSLLESAPAGWREKLDAGGTSRGPQGRGGGSPSALHVGVCIPGPRSRG